MYRVLSPGGALCVIELSTPERFPFRQLYKFYTYTFIPFVGRLVSKDRRAYSYLPRSVAAVPQGEDMLTISVVRVSAIAIVVGLLSALARFISERSERRYY